jgi:hypothetical protein
VGLARFGGHIRRSGGQALGTRLSALLFEINCTEINQSQSSNIFMYIII